MNSGAYWSHARLLYTYWIYLVFILEMLPRLGVGEIELTQKKMRHNIPKVEKEKSQTGWCHEAIRRAVSGFLLTVLLGLLLDSFQWDDFIIHGTDYGHPERDFFLKIPEFWAWADKLGRNFGGHFWVFLAELQHPSWHCESLVYGFEYVIVFSTKNFGFQA